MLSKEREAKLLKIDFIFDGKQAQTVRDDYLAGRLPLGRRGGKEYDV